MRKALYILGDLEDGDIIWLARNGSVRALAPGEELIHEGRAIDHLFFVTDGSFIVSTHGRRIAEVSLGDVLGEMSFVEKRLPTATVTAAANARVLAVPRRAIIAAFDADAGFAARFYRALAVFLSDRLRTATAQTGADDNELDEAVLDNLSMAGDRFVRLIALLEGRMR